MRQIEKQMCAAVEAKQSFNGGNTKVSMHVDARGFPVPNVFLHNNHIATIENGVLRVNRETLRKWPTPTTKSRLRALGAKVTTKAGVTYFDGVAV